MEYNFDEIKKYPDLIAVFEADHNLVEFGRVLESFADLALADKDWTVPYVLYDRFYTYLLEQRAFYAPITGPAFYSSEESARNHSFHVRTPKQSEEIYLLQNIPMSKRQRDVYKELKVKAQDLQKLVYRTEYPQLSDEECCKILKTIQSVVPLEAMAKHEGVTYEICLCNFQFNPEGDGPLETILQLQHSGNEGKVKRATLWLFPSTSKEENLQEMNLYMLVSKLLLQCYSMSRSMPKALTPEIILTLLGTSERPMSLETSESVPLAITYSLMDSLGRKEKMAGSVIERVPARVFDGWKAVSFAYLDSLTATYDRNYVRWKEQRLPQ